MLQKSLILFCILVLIACAKEDDNSGTNPPSADIEIPLITPDGDERYLNEDSDYIFDQNELRTYDLIIPSSNLSKIDADPAAEEYVEAMLIFEGDTISPIGVRYKGSVGAFVNCVSGDDWTNPSGHKTCYKLSMKVKINWKGREDKFYKLRKLQFHSQNLDASQMKERLGYWLFGQMGVPSPRSVHAKLNINGTYAGLFALTEQIDGRFVKYNFDADEGNLYKEIWPLSMGGTPFGESDYINALKTNENNNPSAEIIRSFGNEIANASSQQARDIVEAYMNINEIISYAVVDRTIRHDDGPFHWYCDSDWCSNHNYYFYEEPNNRKLHLIPWDLDNAFENIKGNENPVTPIADAWGQTSNNCEPFRFGWFGLNQWSAACDKLTATWASYDQLYDDLKTQLINGPMSEQSVNEKLNEWSNQIEEATREAEEKHNDALTVDQWKFKVQELKDQLEYARKN